MNEFKYRNKKTGEIIKAVQVCPSNKKLVEGFFGSNFEVDQKENGMNISTFNGRISFFIHNGYWLAFTNPSCLLRILDEFFVNEYVKEE